MKKILIEISPADFLDRLSFLNIRLEKLESPEKKAAVRKAKASLFVGNMDQFNAMNNDTYVRKQYLALQEVNKEIRKLEEIADKTLGIYRQLTNLNEKRYIIKSRINSHLEPSMEEEKSFR